MNALSWSLRFSIGLIAFGFAFGGIAAGAESSARLGTTRAIVPDMFGFNGNMLSRPKAWSEPAMLEAFARSGAALFRYPAGTLANTWDWDRGWLDEDVPAADLIDWVRQFDRGPNAPQRYPLEEVAKLHRATGATVVFVLNLLTKDLAHSVRGLRHARELGLPVKYVEMGNELFFNLPLESRVFPTPEDYGRRCREWIEVLKREFPGVKCAIVAGGRTGNRRSDRWTERALAQCPNADAVVVHGYSSSGLVGRERTNVTGGTEGTVTGVPAVSAEERQRKEMETLRTPEGLEKMLTAGYAAAHREPLPEVRPGLEIWATEWNLRGDNDAVRGTWANTLFAVLWEHGLLENPRVMLSHYHNFIGPGFAAVHTGSRDLAHVRGATLATEPYALTAGGMAVSFFARTATGHTEATRIEIPGVPRLESGGTTAPGAFGWRFSGGKASVDGLLVNVTEQPVEIATAGAVPAGARLITYAARVDTYVARSDSVPKTESKANGRIRLPALSVTLFVRQ